MLRLRRILLRLDFVCSGDIDVGISGFAQHHFQLSDLVADLTRASLGLVELECVPVERVLQRCLERRQEALLVVRPCCAGDGGGRIRIPPRELENTLSEVDFGSTAMQALQHEEEIQTSLLEAHFA
jgi:hypothetical protein